MHQSLDEFKFRPDTDTNTRVICPCASKRLLYNVMTTLAPSFLIGSSSYLQVTRTSITSWTILGGIFHGCVLLGQYWLVNQPVLSFMDSNG